MGYRAFGSIPVGKYRNNTQRPKHLVFSGKFWKYPSIHSPRTDSGLSNVVVLSVSWKPGSGILGEFMGSKWTES